MAYSKTNWVNNTTPINETNLNKIEQGIYDNSLVVDAVTNTLNPTDTETYKTAELTEGQITDVIGVNNILIKGQTSQNGEPTPSSPVDVNVVSGSNVIDIENATTYEPHQGKELPLDLGSIELCKIGDYQDYFYKSGSKWYLHKEIGKVVLDGSEAWNGSDASTSSFLVTYYNTSHLKGKNLPSTLSDRFIYGRVRNESTSNCFEPYNINNFFGINIKLARSITSTLADFKVWLASNNVKLYYILETATNTEITDTTLISQLEAIYNAPLYEQTNITQENNDLPMILDITACKDNIKGIKAFIRK